jgi:hypothetical protein
LSGDQIPGPPPSMVPGIHSNAFVSGFRSEKEVFGQLF